MSEARTLPLHVAPIEGESLDSWLVALAHRTGCTTYDVLAALAPNSMGAVAGRARWLAYLDPEEAAAVSASTGVDCAAVQAMTLARFDGTALAVDRGKRRIRGGFPWGRLGGSRFCPDCLAEYGGRWQLRWHLGWVFGCTRHHRLLAHACPRCERMPRFIPFVSSLTPVPGLCAGPGEGTRRRCGGDLRTAETLRLPDDHPVWLAQHRIAEIIDGDAATFGIYADDPVSARAALADIRAVAQLLMNHAGANELASLLPRDLTPSYEQARVRAAREPGPLASAAPTAASEAAAGAVMALTILGHSTIDAAGAALKWMPRGTHLLTRLNAERGTETSPALSIVYLRAVKARLAPAEMFRFRTAAARPSHPGANSDQVAESLVRRVPAMLWPEWALLLETPPITYRITRAASSAALLLVNTKLNATQASGRVGGVINHAGLGRFLTMLRAHESWDDVLAALTRLSDYLRENTTPIDYARRRTLTYHDLLSDQEWTRVCAAASVHPGGSSKTKLTAARCFLYERISGLPFDMSPQYIDTVWFRGHMLGFPRRLTPAMSEQLDHACLRFLSDHDVSGEPVSWCPPMELVDGLTLPGNDPSTIDIQELHGLVGVGREGSPLSEVASQLSTSIDVIRHLLTTHPISAGQPRRAGSQLQAAARELPEQQLIDLYQRQRLSMKAIAARTGVRAEVVSDLLDLHGIDKRRTSRGDIDAEWLHSQYVEGNRTLADIAQELGVTASTVYVRAKECGVPTRSRNRCLSSTGYLTDHDKLAREYAERDHEFAVLLPGLGRRHGWERLWRFTVAVEHRSISAAATQIGVTKDALRHQIVTVEGEFGAALLNRNPTGYRQRTTPLGEVIALAATKLAALIN